MPAAGRRRGRCRSSALPRPAAGGYFDDGGFPVGEGWDEIAFPAVSDEHAYALEVSGQSMEPAYRDGDVILISPAAPIRRGDRVVVRTKSGEVMAKELKRRTAKSIELRSLNPEHADRTLRLPTCCGSRGFCGRASSGIVRHPEVATKRPSKDELAEALGSSPFDARFARTSGNRSNIIDYAERASAPSIMSTVLAMP